MGDSYFDKGGGDAELFRYFAAACLTIAFVAAVIGYCFVAWCCPQLAEWIAVGVGMLIGVCIILMMNQ